MRCVTVLWLLLFVLLPTPVQADYEEGEIVLSILPGESIDEVNARWGTTLLESYPPGGLYLVHAEGVEELEELADAMTEDPAIEWAEANYLEETPEGVRMMVVNAVGGTMVDYEDQEITTRIGLEEAHQVTRGGGITVAVLDTGVDPDHEALQGKIADAGYDFVDDDAQPWEEANGVDDDGDGFTDDGFGHGSMVAGIIALVSPDAAIMPVRVLDDEGRSDAFRIAKAIHFAVSQGADVINMSFGSPQDVGSIEQLADWARDRGVSTVAGAGNENRESPAYHPAVARTAIMVTALDSLDRKADFADWNPEVLVSAPGTGVRSALPGNEWGLGSGCSFATPFVTGEIALILSLEPDLIPGAIQARVASAVQSIDQIPGNEPYEEALGAGRIYLPLAVAGVVGVSGAPTVPTLRLLAVPNPTSGSVALEFNALEPLSPSAHILVHDLTGRLVRRLPATGADLSWDGRDAGGRAVASGIYYIRLLDGSRSSEVSIRVLR